MARNLLQKLAPPVLILVLLLVAYANALDAPFVRDDILRIVNDPAIRNWKTGGYIDRLPKDPWGNEYQYLNPGNNGEIDIYTLGRDGRPGGEGLDADIGNWNID